MSFLRMSLVYLGSFEKTVENKTNTDKGAVGDNPQPSPRFKIPDRKELNYTVANYFVDVFLRR